MSTLTAGSYGWVSKRGLDGGGRRLWFKKKWPREEKRVVIRPGAGWGARVVIQPTERDLVVDLSRHGNQAAQYAGTQRAESEEG